MTAHDAFDTVDQKKKSRTYPSLAEVRKSLVVRWYRCPIDRTRLHSYFMVRSDLEGAMQCLGHFLIWLCTGAVLWRAAEPAGGAPVSCGSLAIALFVHGTVGSTFLYGCHELGHGTVFKSRWLNRFWLHVYSALSWWDPYDYGTSHTYHHRYSQYVEGDRENVLPLEPSLNPALMLQMFTLNLTPGPGRVFGTGGLLWTVRLRVLAAMGGVASAPGAESHEWLTSLHEDQPQEAIKSLWWNRCLVAFHVCVLAAAAVSGHWVLLPAVSFHAFFANWLSYFVGNTQHMGLRGEVPDFRLNTRTVLLDPISQFLFWHMNFHIEHHMYAGVPCYRLAELHQELIDDMPKPRTLVGAWLEMRDTWQRQQLDPGYAFDTPLPSAASTAQPEKSTDTGNKVHADSSANSIGDLAPLGLRARGAGPNKP